MVDKKTKFFVGLFVAAGVTIIVAVVIWLGMTSLFKRGQHFAVYFNESVQGLNVEAPVKYRGVAIGRVEAIKVAADSHLIEVVLSMNKGFRFSDKVFAQLRIVGITGNMFVELDRFPEGVPIKPPKLDFPSEYPIIPSRPSDIKQLFQSVDEIIQKLKVIDIAGMTNRFQKVLVHLDEAIVNSDVARLSAHAQSTLDKIDQTVTVSKLPETVQHLNELLAKLNLTLDEMDLAGLSKETRQTLTDLRQESAGIYRTAKPLLATASSTMDVAESGIVNLNQQMMIISRKLEETVTKLNTVIGKINDQPSQLFFSGPPPPRQQP